jgi:hypothetical protein
VSDAGPGWRGSSCANSRLVVKGLQPLLVHPRVVGGVQTLLGGSRSEHVQTILLVVPSGGTGSDGGSDGTGDVEVSWGGLGGGGRGGSLWGGRLGR